MPTTGTPYALHCSTTLPHRSHSAGQTLREHVQYRDFPRLLPRTQLTFQVGFEGKNQSFRMLCTTVANPKYPGVHHCDPNEHIRYSSRAELSKHIDFNPAFMQDQDVKNVLLTITTLERQWPDSEWSMGYCHRSVVKIQLPPRKSLGHMPSHEIHRQPKQDNHRITIRRHSKNLSMYSVWFDHYRAAMHSVRRMNSMGKHFTTNSANSSRMCVSSATTMESYHVSIIMPPD